MQQFYFLEAAFFLPATVFLLPFLVLALVLVLWPRTGKPLLCLLPLLEPISISLLILACTSDFKAPSTLISEVIILRIWLTSSSVKSATFLSWLIPVLFRISSEVVLPIPKIEVKPITTLLFFGRSIPAILAN